MKKVWKNILHQFFIMTAISVVLIAASIWAYRSTYPKELTLSEDGYYQIYTPYDYDRFWQMVAHNQMFICGRLMNDIYLNDISDFSAWQTSPPARQSRDVLFFSGDFDGGGHTIYGLYSENGFGIVRKNMGVIHDLFIENSLVVGEECVGGICQTNNKVIENCEFGGILSSNLITFCEDVKMAGICVENTGTIKRCGYTGSMEVSGDWAQNGVMAGICAENKDEVFNCYNLTQDYYSKEEEYCYAITDRKEEGCFIGENLKDSTYYDRHTMLLDKAQAVYISAFLDHDLYAVYQAENHLPAFLKPPVEETFDLTCLNLFPIGRSFQTKSPSGEDIGIKMESALTDDVISSLIWAILEYNGERWDTVSIQVMEEIKEAWTAIQVSDGQEKVSLSIYLMEETPETEVSYDKIWTYCSEILGQKDAESWEHNTWKLAGGEGSTIKDNIFILYQTDEKKQGFFYTNDKMLYQVEGVQAVSESEMQQLKEQLSGARQGDESGEEPYGIQKIDGMWMHMFEAVCESRSVIDTFSWQDQIVKQAVYYQATASEDGMPSVEEIMDIRCLQIENADQAAGFQDLAMLPQLRTLYILWGGLTDISFVKNLPELEDISFYGNEIQDISPLTACKNLKVLSLGFNKVEDITPLAELTSLKELGLQGNEIKDIEALRFLPELEGVNLNGNQITDLSPLSGKTKLAALGAGYNQIKDISPLKGMNQLYNLALDMNQISDIRVLKEMTQLEYLGLAYNQIEDFEPIKGMEKLFLLSVMGNPAQDIGNLIFVPMLNMGSSGMLTEEDINQAQEYLDLYYPEQEIEAEDIVWGDLNGDGIKDLAVTGLSQREEDMYYPYCRKIYPFLGQTDGRLRPLDGIETLDPESGGVYGDPYQGVIITDEKLVVQVYGGSNWRWGDTRIYEYENGHMVEKWKLEINHWLMTDGLDWRIYDEERNLYRSYAVAGNIEGKRNILLVEQGKMEGEECFDPAKEILDEKMKDFEDMAGQELPQIERVDIMPAIGGDGYDYQVYDTLLSVKYSPGQVLKMASEKFMTDSIALPVSFYSCDEIIDSYVRLTGIEVPTEFYLGKNKGEPKLLAYVGCRQNEEGDFVHTLKLEEVNENYWVSEKVIYFDEGQEKFIINF